MAAVGLTEQEAASRDLAYLVGRGDAIDCFIHTTLNVPPLCEAYKYAAYDRLQRWQEAAHLVADSGMLGRHPTPEAAGGDVG